VKGKARGTLARLEALEDRERDRAAAVETVKEDAAARALETLAPADRAALFEHLDAQEAGGAWWAEVCRATAALEGPPLEGPPLEGPPLEDPAGEAARAWEELTIYTPAGVAYPLPPMGAAAYFEREAARCDTVKKDAAGLPLPDSLWLEAVQTAARWSAAMWRFEAVFALELGEVVKT
jgi:hypothetical protein